MSWNCVSVEEKISGCEFDVMEAEREQRSISSAGEQDVVHTKALTEDKD